MENFIFELVVGYFKKKYIYIYIYIYTGQKYHPWRILVSFFRKRKKKKKKKKKANPSATSVNAISIFLQYSFCIRGAHFYSSDYINISTE